MPVRKLVIAFTLTVVLALAGCATPDATDGPDPEREREREPSSPFTLQVMNNRDAFVRVNVTATGNGSTYALGPFNVSAHDEGPVVTPAFPDGQYEWTIRVGNETVTEAQEKYRGIDLKVVVNPDKIFLQHLAVDNPTPSEDNG